MEKEKIRLFMQTVLRTQASFRQAVQRSIRNNSIDLTFEMLQIMAYLWKKEGVNQQELADQTFKDKASLTYLINNLESKGLVNRVEGLKDRRNKEIYLTDKGKELEKEIIPLIESLYATAADQSKGIKIEPCMDALDLLKDIFNTL